MSTPDGQPVAHTIALPVEDDVESSVNGSSTDFIEVGPEVAGGDVDGESYPHPDLWMSDGNIVIIAESTMFRVHKGVLGRHSEVFSDLWDVPQPTATADVVGDSDNVQGCPVVRLQDSADDVSYLLLALYDGDYFQAIDPQPFERVAGILRLSTKYMITYLRRRAISYLTQAFPTTLEQWDALRNAEVGPFDITPADGPHPIAVINLARETQVLDILPAAYYACCELPLHSVLYGTPTETGQECLSLHDLQVFISGRDKVAKACREIIAKCFVVDEHACYGRAIGIASSHHTPITDCKPVVDHLALAILKELSSLTSADPLTQSAVVHDVRHPNWPSAQLCESCRTIIRSSVIERRQLIWESLPSWFGLPDWTTLRSPTRVSSAS